MGEARELKLAFLACLGLIVVYAAYAVLAEEDGGHLFGHGLGILGAGLMLATETLYSVRKRTGLLRWAGPVRYWLSAHIFTGIVGPFLVLMHTAFEFRGLAGVTAGLTTLVVASGFVGRYLYTAIPRSLAGVETSATDLAADLRRTEAALAAEHSPALQALVRAEASAATGSAGWGPVLLRGWDAWAYRRRVRGRLRQLERSEPGRLRAVERLLVERHTRARQLQTISAARRLLSVWHTLHVPLGVALFASVAVHVVATLYFGAGRLP
jgi:hypothetical protein